MLTISNFTEGSYVSIYSRARRTELYAVLLNDKIDGKRKKHSADFVFVFPFCSQMKSYKDEDANDVEKDRVPHDGCHELFPDMLNDDGECMSYGWAGASVIQEISDDDIRNGDYVITPMGIDPDVLKKVMERFKQKEYPVVKMCDGSGQVQDIAPKKILELYRNHPPTKTYHLDGMGYVVDDVGSKFRNKSWQEDGQGAKADLEKKDFIKSRRRLAEFEDFMPNGSDLARAGRMSSKDPTDLSLLNR